MRMQELQFKLQVEVKPHSHLRASGMPAIISGGHLWVTAGCHIS